MRTVMVVGAVLLTLTACDGKGKPVDRGICGTQICVKATAKCENPGKTPASGLFSIEVRAKDPAAKEVSYRFEAIDDDGRVDPQSGPGVAPVKGEQFRGESIGFGAPVTLKFFSQDDNMIAIPRSDPGELCAV